MTTRSVASHSTEIVPNFSSDCRHVVVGTTRATDMLIVIGSPVVFEKVEIWKNFKALAEA